MILCSLINNFENKKYDAETLNNLRKEYKYSFNLKNRYYIRKIYCEVCDYIKDNNVYHCKKCNKCTKKMDHHCDWVGNCIGKFNHKLFVLYLVYKILMYILFILVIFIIFENKYYHKSLENRIVY